MSAACGGLIVSVNGCVSVCGVGRVASATFTANENEPALEGVSASVPAVPSSDKPDGSVPEASDQV